MQAMFAGRQQLQYAPDQGSSSPIYGTTDDHDGASFVMCARAQFSAFCETLDI